MKGGTLKLQLNAPFSMSPLIIDAEARFLERDPAHEIRAAAARALSDSFPAVALSIADVVPNSAETEFVGWQLSGNGPAIRFAITFAPCCITKCYPTHRCPECRFYLADDARDKCTRCGARLDESLQRTAAELFDDYFGPGDDENPFRDIPLPDQDWRDAGFDSVLDIEDWKSLGVSLSDAVRFADFGITLDSVVPWLTSGQNPQVWRDAGISTEEATYLLWRDPNVTVLDVSKMHALGCEFDVVLDWHDLHLSMRQLERSFALNIRPETLRRWVGADYDADSAITAIAFWQSEGMDDPHPEWAQLGFDPQTADDYASLGIEPRSAVAMRSERYDISVKHWVEAGFDPEEIAAWAEHRFEADDAAEWRDLGFDASEANAWAERNIAPSEARRLSDRGERPTDHYGVL